ncbi:MAG: hypothetical protein ACXIUZ_14275 [Lysobacteraceae bacterium]
MATAFSLNTLRKGALGLAAATVLALSPAVLLAQSAQDIRDTRAAIEAEFSPGGQYAHLTPMQKREVSDGLEVMERLLARHGSIERMRERDRVTLYNRQERVNQILTGMSEDEMIVCDREQRTGTRMRDTQCGSVAERRERREDEQARLGGMRRGSMPAGN